MWHKTMGKKSNECDEDLKLVLRLVELQVALKDPCTNAKYTVVFMRPKLMREASA